MKHSGMYTDVPTRQAYFHMPGLTPHRPTSQIYVPSPYRAGQTLMRSKC